LILSGNQIGNEGAEYLEQALQYNTVTLHRLFYTNQTLLSYYYIDT